ncbi:isochorismate synthase [uncultured Bacteroides sp.]|uniref:isochorismate synthase n=1 Tax=uncultured Bacteroides sp. TaxID=162156 RepID=UPI002AAA7999|nr:isochorismate synthase [uncultured Bacteroides sp.]
MTFKYIDNSTQIDELIERKQSFALYQSPKENRVHFLTQKTGNAQLLYSVEELNGIQGFIIAPFQVSQKYPIVVMQPDYEEVSEKIALTDQDLTNQQEIPLGMCNASRDTQEVQLEGYSRKFALFSDVLHKKEFDKLVLSRSYKLKRNPSFSPAMAFYKACRRYAHSYVYLCYTPETGVWLGSTPEIILSGEQGQWTTTALAGTQSLQQNELPINWDNKNKEEQMLVAAYIRQQLLSKDIHPTEKGPYAIRAGELAHLKTDFHFTLSETKELGSMLNLLHPTPAVCGLPKEKAYRFIKAHEGYERQYYSGFIGLLSPKGKTELYVNLRCMNINKETLTLYAGGGLLASSSMEEEWNETEKKLQTMLVITDNK